MTNDTVTINLIDIHRISYITSKLPDDIFLDLKNECEELIKNKFNEKNKPSHKNNLVGAIEHEYLIDGNVAFIDLLKKLVVGYHNILGKTVNEDQINILRPWANFQKNGEYNPIHNHSGVISYVIWIKIPYDSELENNHPSVKGSNRDENWNGPNFSFIVSDFTDPSYGGIKRHPINLNKNYEGMICMFPSWLYHEVTPFLTTDEYRISIAGNIDIN
jgi:hypothetical protein